MLSDLFSPKIYLERAKEFGRCLTGIAYPPEPDLNTLCRNNKIAIPGDKPEIQLRKS